MAFTILINTLLTAAPYIVVGFLVAGAVHQWAPQDLLMRHLGKQGGLPLLKAVGIGSLLPICSCGTIPLGVGLYRCGAATGTVLSFMTSSPILSPVVVLVASKLLGFKLTLMLLGSALMSSFVIGWIGNRLLPNVVEQQKRNEPQFEPVPAKDGSPIRQWLRWSFLDLGAHVSVELLIGLSLAALVLTMLPGDTISAWLGQRSLSTLFYVILLGIPVYTCSVPSVPLVHGLLLMGATPGVAVAYMIAGPATNLGELNAIRRNMGGWTAVYYAIALLVVAMISGVAADQVFFAGYEYQAAYVQENLVIQKCCVPVIFESSSQSSFDPLSVSPLEWITGGMLLVVIVIGLTREIREFISAPCKSCLWRDYQKTNRCAAHCHVRRKHDRFKQVIQFLSIPSRERTDISRDET